MDRDFEEMRQFVAIEDAGKLQLVWEDWKVLEGGTMFTFKMHGLRIPVERRDKDLVKILVRVGCRVEEITMESILQHTSKTGDLGLIQAIIDGGFDVNECLSEYRGDALLIAIAHKKRPAIELLLSHGADPNLNRRMGSETALELAAEVASPEVVELLLQHGATWKNRAALHYAAIYNRTDIAAVLLRYGQNISAIPVDEEIPDRYFERGWGTALHEAARKGHENMVRFLLEHGIDKNLRDSCGLTAAEVASANQHEDIARIIYTPRGTSPW